MSFNFSQSISQLIIFISISIYLILHLSTSFIKSLLKSHQFINYMTSFCIILSCHFFKNREKIFDFLYDDWVGLSRAITLVRTFGWFWSKRRRSCDRLIRKWRVGTKLWILEMFVVHDIIENNKIKRIIFRFPLVNHISINNIKNKLQSQNNFQSFQNPSF